MSPIQRRSAGLGLLSACLLLSACETLNPRPKVDLAPQMYARPQAMLAPPVNNGAIFQAQQYRPLFEDHRARLVGDALTVQITEKVSATQSSTSSIDKTGSIKAGISALAVPLGQLLRPRQRHGFVGEHLRRQGQHREHQQLRRHHHRHRHRGAAQRPPDRSPARSRSA